MPGSPRDHAKLSLLPSGFLTLPEHRFCADQSDESIRNTVPSMSFLVQHPSGHRIVFDMGMRKKLGDYPADIQPHLQTRHPIHTDPDVSDSLRAGGLTPDDVDTIILSHVHYDHVGTPSDFKQSNFIVGYGARHLLHHGMNYHSAAKFEKDLLPEDRTVELPLQSTVPKYERPVESELRPTKTLDDILGPGHAWQPLGPFDNAIDLFQDGLVYIVDSPGHLAGHLNLLVKVASNHWVYLAGDACHHARLLDGQTEFAQWEENGAQVCIHADKELATQTLRRIQELRARGFEGRGIVDVVLAHDAEWYSSNQDAIFPGVFRGSSA